MRDREENWGGRREGIRDSPKTGVLSGTHLCRDYVSSFHGIIHWTWWIVIFFHFSFFLIFWPPYWFFAFFFVFFPIFHLSSISSINHTTKGHTTTRNTEEWDRQAHQHVFSVREKKKLHAERVGSLSSQLLFENVHQPQGDQPGRPWIWEEKVLTLCTRCSINHPAIEPIQRFTTILSPTCVPRDELTIFDRVSRITRESRRAFKKKKRKDIRNIGEDIHRCYLERGSQ